VNEKDPDWYHDRGAHQLRLGVFAFIGLLLAMVLMGIYVLVTT
jgi:hypothetical protein